MVTKDLGTQEHALQLFENATESLGGVDAKTVSSLISSSSDIAVVLDRTGVVLDVSVATAELAALNVTSWIGRLWRDCVTIESRIKVDELIADALTKGSSRWRQVNHSLGSGPDVPVRYSAIGLGGDGRVVAVGRDLRAISTLQQRLVDVQQAMEREYARIRSAETRYRLLFQLASEAVVIVDAGTNRIVEANPTASRLLNLPPKRLSGMSFGDPFDAGSAQAVQSLLAAARSSGRVDDVLARLDGGKTSLLLSAALFRQDGAAHLLIRLRPMEGEAPSLPSGRASVLQVIERLPEAFVVTDMDRKIMAANTAFLDLAQIPTEQQLKGEAIDRWIGRPGLDVDALFASLRTHGAVRNFSTILRSEFGAIENVELAAVLVEGGEVPCIGFSIRSVGWRAAEKAVSGPQLPSSQQFTELVGRVSLKDMVRETTDLIERLCIEAALELTRDNRASAAEMLGLSRQSLYSKLRRFNMGDLDGEVDESAPN